MATTRVLAGSDTRAPEEWRVGIVDRGPDHVYGKTAFTPREWRHLSHLRERQGWKFVVRTQGGHQQHPVIPVRKSLCEAMGDLRVAIDKGEEHYGPHLGVQVAILAVRADGGAS